VVCFSPAQTSDKGGTETLFAANACCTCCIAVHVAGCRFWCRWTKATVTWMSGCCWDLHTLEGSTM
jgi:hypothetical protein